MSQDETRYRFRVLECISPTERVLGRADAWCAEYPRSCHEDWWRERVVSSHWGVIIRAEVMDRRMVAARGQGTVCDGLEVGTFAEVLIFDDEPNACERIRSFPGAWYRERYSGLTCDTIPPGPACLLGLPTARYVSAGR